MKKEKPAQSACQGELIASATSHLGFHLIRYPGYGMSRFEIQQCKANGEVASVVLSDTEMRMMFAALEARNFR